MQALTTSGWLTEALRYAKLGWRVIPLHPREKRPIPKAWQKAATTDEEILTQWAEQHSGANIGVVLGESSRIIDIECDSPAAEETLCELHGGDVPVTPCYQAVGGRGKHRLFRWSSELPFSDKAVFKIGELEFRTGNGGLGAQSVLPPSVHPGGGLYQWLVPPEDCDPAELRGDFLARVANYFAEGQLELSDAEQIAKRRKPPEHWEKLSEGVSEGSRNESAASYVGKILRNTIDLDDAGAMWLLYDNFRAWNQRNQPPLSERELRATFDSIRRREHNRRVAEEGCDPETAETGDPETGLTDDPKRLLAFCRKGLNLPELLGVNRRVSDKSLYELVLPDRAIVVGDVGKLRSKKAVGNCIFDELARVIPGNKQSWPLVALALRKIAIDVGQTEGEKLREWLLAYEGQTQFGGLSGLTAGSPDWWRAVLRAMSRAIGYHHSPGCVRDDRNRLWVHAAMFTEFVSSAFKEHRSAQEVRAILSRAGFVDRRRNQRDETTGKTFGLNLWGSPEGAEWG